MGANFASPQTRGKIRAGAMAATIALGLCSCTSTTGPEPNPAPTVDIEQPVEPATTASPDADDTIDEGDWVVSQSLVVPEGITFLAQTDPNYEFSDDPQDRAEQWLYDQWPELWDQGVRSVSDGDWTPGIAWDQGGTPPALVQYINGERAEGTEDIPLRFRGQATDINKYPTDVYPNLMKAFQDRSSSIASVGAIGQGGYQVYIVEHYGYERGKVITTTMNIYAYEEGFDEVDAGGGKRRNFDTWEDAWGFIEENGFQPSTKGSRTLYPGEIASVVVVRELDSGIRQTVLLNPETGEWDLVSEYR